MTDEEGYEYDIAEKKTIFNIFNFESEELDQVLRQAHPGNAALTSEMRTFKSEEKMLVSKNG